MTGTVHVVGAGLAGLAAALALARAGLPVRMHEAAARAGGRCAAVLDGHDNGTHVLLGANPAASSLLRTIGASTRWFEPEPDGLPVADLTLGQAWRLGISPGSWLSRPPPWARLQALARLARLASLVEDRPVAGFLGEDRFSRAVLEPLTLAALNTPPEEASAKLLARVLRRALLPGGGRVYVAREGLGPDLIAPALAALAEMGVHPKYHCRLMALERRAGGVERLHFAAGEIRLAAGDQVVLALPPHALARLLPDMVLPQRYEPIVNIHFAAAYDGPPRLVGLLGGLGQWVLYRAGAASVTISAARAAVERRAADLLAEAAAELARAAALVDLSADGLKPVRVVKERRATLSQSVGRWPYVNRHPFVNVVLAGDWLSPLPATIEAAIRSGREAARLVRSPGRDLAPLISAAG